MSCEQSPAISCSLLQSWVILKHRWPRRIFWTWPKISPSWKLSNWSCAWRLQPRRQSHKPRDWSAMIPCDFFSSCVIPYAVLDRPMQSPTVLGCPQTVLYHRSPPPFTHPGHFTRPLRPSPPLYLTTGASRLYQNSLIWHVVVYVCLTLHCTMRASACGDMAVLYRCDLYFLGIPKKPRARGLHKCSCPLWCIAVSTNAGLLVCEALASRVATHSLFQGIVPYLLLRCCVPY